MTNVRITPPNTFPLANLRDPEQEARATRYDGNRKGYLTFDELAAWYQAENQGALPTLNDLANFLGATQHSLKAEYLTGWDALNAQWTANNWKGDFNIPNFAWDNSYKPAGNVRTGRQVGPQWDENGQRDVDQTVFLFDCNLINRGDFDGRVRAATLVVGPTNFPTEAHSQYGESVEIPLTLVSQEGFQTYSRFGPSGWSPEKKLLVAQVDTGDLRRLAASANNPGGGLSFFARIDLNDGKTVYINRDGVVGQNFEVAADDIRAAGQP